MALDLNKILEEIKKAKSESEVRSVQVGGKDVFDKKERVLLDSTRIKSVSDARKAAELLARIKVAVEKKQKDDDLLDKLEKERDDNDFAGSMVYRVLNVNNLVRNTTDYLTFLTTGVPEDKEERKKKATKLQKEIAEKRAELTLNNSALTPLEAQLKAVLEDQGDSEKLLERREAVVDIIANNSNTDFTISHQGTEKKISSMNVSDVKNYDNDKL